MTLRTLKFVSVSALVSAAGFLGGCQDGVQYPPVGVNDNFPADDERRALDNMVNQQAANGAREDGTFYACHFTDGRLNSLGYQKLSAMSYGPEIGKLAIYLDVPRGEQYAACQYSIVKAMARGNWPEDHYTITAGQNPDVSAPATASLADLSRQHGGRSDQSSSPDAGVINPINSGATQSPR